MKTEKEIVDKIYELESEIKHASENGDTLTMNVLIANQTALKWVIIR